MDIGTSNDADLPEKSLVETPPETKKRRVDLAEPGENNSAYTSPATRQNDTIGSSEDALAPSYRSCDEIVRSLVNLEVLPTKKASNLRGLNKQEKIELESVFGINQDQPWREDWAGNLALADEDIPNPDEIGRKKQSFRQSLFLWAANNKTGKRLIYNLIRMVVNVESTPAEARRILSFVDPTSLTDMEKKIRRTSYDPVVLQQDGWSTEKTEHAESASGSTTWIGEMVRWQNADAIVLAYVYDSDIGDLWKVAWIEEGDLTTFDMEVEELQEARKKWIRRQAGASKLPVDASARKSSRFLSSENFTVAGVEEGIVLASSISKFARQGVYWPARILHPSESVTKTSHHKRSSSKQKVELVFLAPYWDSEISLQRNRKVEGMFESGPRVPETGALFQIESVDAMYETIQPYPFDPDGAIDIDHVKNSFRFTGLPKSVFPRFLDSHRLAMALKLYARNHARRSDSPATMATAGLFETHPLAVRAPIFPPVILHLPFPYILSQLPPSDSYNNAISPSEKILKLSAIVKSMNPPNSWGDNESNQMGTPDRPTTASQQATSTPSIKLFKREDKPEDVLREVVAGLPNLQHVFSGDLLGPVATSFVRSVSDFILAIAERTTGTGTPNDNSRLRHLANQWTIVRSTGEAALYSTEVHSSDSSAILSHEWCLAAERLYRHFVQQFGLNDQTLLVTDWRCNLHLTNGTAFERCVRLPAALKGAKLAGLGVSEHLTLQKSVSDAYLDYVEHKLLSRAHETKYLEKLKARCSSVQSSSDVIMLTEDSDGKGGEDTRGSQGTWKAAVCAVAAAVTAVDKVVCGDFVNAFCATRPPGHHAGRSMHAMKAVSNGFCVLNPAACAAIHAVTPICEGGRGLDRVCVVDFDVHHGNGTQDILCSTFDSRFLYVSIHAGGSHVNGLPPDEDLSALLPHANKHGGIYPGRCGDKSPHPHVLNIPLGQRVTPHAVGSALISRVTPAVERFWPNLIILSAGFDAHKHDPMGLGSLAAQDFGHITEVLCQLATRCCSGRLVSVLEGGYGVPCCRPQKMLPQPPPPPPSLPASSAVANEMTCQLAGASGIPETAVVPIVENPTVSISPPHPGVAQPSYKLFDLGPDLPDDMDDQLPPGLPRRLDKCHLEGFTDCVKEHLSALANCRVRK